MEGEISAMTFVLVDGERQAVVETEGDQPGTWCVCYEDDDTEEYDVPLTRLTICAKQRDKPTNEQVEAGIAFLKQRMALEQEDAPGEEEYNRMRLEADKNPVNVPDEIWRDHRTDGAVCIGNGYTSSSRVCILTV